ncbi:glycosyltransferase family 4 protein [Falsihalocynthiibacter sp. SS001]|uniref:glycosyltransferase family 4 protein n=1 Tax=Falsihalocynthiibacter sp. SS001 TaxID=3349698 RepID=UPI0036D38613
MHGGGTKQDITPNKPPARLLDLSRLVSRVGRGPLTGVDRVEMAYLYALLQDSVPLFALVRISGGFVVLDENGTQALWSRMVGKTPWGRPDINTLLRRKLSPAQRCAQADCHRLAVSKSREITSVLGSIPRAFSYINVGHSNLSAEVLAAIKSCDAHVSVMVHDLIPIDFPEFQRSGTVAKFEEKMRAVSQYADLVIYNSKASQADGERHFEMIGRVPSGIVAHLGVTVAQPDDTPLPDEIAQDRPYFVCVGTIEPRKNHHLLLDVWEGWDDAPQLVLIGARGWSNEDVFARLDAKLENVIELNNFPDRVVAKIVQNAAGMLFPSFAEGFGLPPAEALLLQTPVVCADLPVYQEFMGDMPIYLNPQDRYAWTSTIQTLAAKHKSEEPIKFDPDSLPTWTAHFGKVLSVV